MVGNDLLSSHVLLIYYMTVIHYLRKSEFYLCKSTANHFIITQKCYLSSIPIGYAFVLEFKIHFYFVLVDSLECRIHIINRGMKFDFNDFIIILSIKKL